MRRLAYVLALLSILAASCGLPASGAPVSAPVVLTTTTILADMARNVAGERAKIESLLPFGADPHSYEPVPADVAKISHSTLLIVNGLGYEHFLGPLLENAGGQRLIITASDGLEAHQTEEEGHTATDPHMWLDPSRVIKYVENIRDGLTKSDPDGAATYQSNAEAYMAQLQQLDTWIKEQVSKIPPERRLLVTNHEAFGYFADRYGFRIIGTVVPSVSSEAAPSAQRMAALIEQIKSSSAPAIFLDASDSPNLAEQISSETNVKVISDLHLESLTDGPPAATYLEMMKYNVTQLVNALQ